MIHGPNHDTGPLQFHLSCQFKGLTNSDTRSPPIFSPDLLVLRDSIEPSTLTSTLHFLLTFFLVPHSDEFSLVRVSVSGPLFFYQHSPCSSSYPPTDLEFRPPGPLPLQNTVHSLVRPLSITPRDFRSVSLNLK